jgi:hypothetical protein
MSKNYKSIYWNLTINGERKMENLRWEMNHSVFDSLKAELEIVELEERLEMVSLMAAVAKPSPTPTPSNGCCCCNA